MEQTAFLKIVGDTPMMRIWDFLLIERGLFDYSMTEIARNSHVSWTKFNKIFPELVKRGIVRQTRRIGRARLYMLNEENPITKAMIDLHKKTSLAVLESQTKEKKRLVAVQTA